jgi:hypothetical protein
VGKHVLTLPGMQRRRGSSKDDVVSNGKGARADTAGGLRGRLIGVDPHLTEVMT